MTTDVSNLPELTSRQERILSFIVRAYTQKPEPISSKHIYEASDLNVSSATIRNEMAILEELGYIAAPHKSAGRIPTEDGFRYFVNRLLNNISLSDTEKKHIASKFQALPMVTEQWMRLAANVLARTANTASLVTAPIAQTTRFKHIELISVQGRLVLMVLVLHGGIIQQRMLNLAEPVPQARLAEAATHINGLCTDLYANQIRMKGIQLNLLEREVAELVAEVMEQADSNPTRTVYRDGLSDVINSFQDGEGAQQALRVFEERAFLDIIISELVDPFIDDDVRVIVAGDGRWAEINQLSMVLTRYGVPGQMSGTIGVLGPTHINYGRAISTVRYVSSLMTNMLVDLYEIDLDESSDLYSQSSE
ncbi:MAG: heat-inducible transcriptional repressor HrcA [Chloroflexota bacterium]